jgi:putative phage-type endonuclease
MSKLSGPVAYSDEWYNMRLPDEGRNPAFVCGASDAGVICGVSKYKTRLELYMELRGLKDRKPMGENAFWGTRHEPTIMQVFQQRTGYDFKAPSRLFMHEDYPMIGATPDGEGEDDQGNHITIDAKCTTSRLYDPENCRVRDCFGEKHDEIPSDYIMQGQQQMLVCDASRCHFPVLFDGNNLRHYWIDANPIIQDSIVKNVLSFYDEVMSGRAPDPDFKHDTTVALVKEIYDIDPGVEIEFTEDLVPIYQVYTDAKAEIGRLTRAKEEAQAKLLFAMGDASVANVPTTGRQLVRSKVKERLWTQDDVEAAMLNLGTVKKRAHIRVTDRKAK